MRFHVWTSLILLVRNVFAESEPCNPIECFAELNAIFQSSVDKNACQKITKIQRCVELCILKENSGALKKGLELVKLELCEENDGEKLFNKCVNKHKFLLFSCLYKSLNLEAVNSSVDLDLLYCRKGMEGQHCDQQSLVACSFHAGYVTETLLVKLFQPLIDDHCKSFSYEVWSLDVKPPPSYDDYENLAECLDNNNEALTSCVPVKWSITNAVFSSATTNKLCKAVDSLSACIHNVVQRNCQNVESAFLDIKQSLLQYFTPFCFKKKIEFQDFETFQDVQDQVKNQELQVSSSTATTISHANISNGTRTDLLIRGNQFPSSTTAATSELNKNVSEVVVVHQHIVFNVVEQLSKGSDIIISFRILVFLMLAHVLNLKCCC